jgi:chemotaxis protein MotB
MTSFADLISLLLAFFVLLYAAETGGAGQWERIRSSLSAKFNPGTAASEGGSTRVELSRMVPVGRDLDYLSTVLAERIATEATLAGVRVDRRAEGIFVVFPEGILFEPGRHSLSDEIRTRLGLLVDILSKVPNKIEVYGHTDPSNPEEAPQAWRLSIARAMAVSYELRRAGYPYAITSMGYAGGRFEELSEELSAEDRARLARRVEIIVRGDST